MLWKSKNYKYDVKCDDQQQYKAIPEAAMVSTNDGLTEKITTYVKKNRKFK